MSTKFARARGRLVEVVTLTDEIAALNADMDSKKKDMQAATEIRDKEKASDLCTSKILDIEGQT